MLKIGNLIISGLFLSISTAAFAKNEWTNPLGNPAHTGFLAQKTTPANYRVLWTKNTGEFISKPVISDNIYYIDVKDDGVYELVAVNLKNGNDIWKKDEKENFTMDYAVAYNDKVFVTSAHGINTSNQADYHVLDSYNAKSGDLKYSIRVSNRDEYAVEPIAFADSVYIQKSLLESIDANSGTHKWIMNISNDYQPESTLSLNDKYIFSTADKKINVYNRAWGQPEFSLALPHDRDYVLEPFPVLDQKNNAVYYIDVNDKDNTNHILAYDLKTHALKWSKQYFANAMIVANGEIYAAGFETTDPIEAAHHSPAEIISLDANTGEIKWRWSDDTLTQDNYFKESFVATSDTIFISSDTATYAISTKTHQTVWKTFTHGKLALGKNTLLITGNTGITAIALN